MAVNNPQSADRSYKFIYKLLGLAFHRYLYNEGEEIEFIETEIPDTGQLKDMSVKVDGKTVQITEFMTKPLYEKKLKDLFDYHDSTRIDCEYDGFNIKTGVFSIANPKHGKNMIKIDENIIFQVNTRFQKIGMAGKY